MRSFGTTTSSIVWPELSQDREVAIQQHTAMLQSVPALFDDPYERALVSFQFAINSPYYLKKRTPRMRVLGKVQNIIECAKGE